jgi:hypothetical protein
MMTVTIPNLRATLHCIHTDDVYANAALPWLPPVQPSFIQDGSQTMLGHTWLSTAVLVALSVTTTSLAQQATPTTPPPGAPPGMPIAQPETHYTAAIQYKDGKSAASQDAAVLLKGGQISASHASGFTLNANKPDINGVLIRGKQRQYTVSNANMKLTGNGSNDFAGVGSGIMAEGGATVVVRHVDIETSGRIRSAVTSAAGSILKVYDSTLRANGGELPPGYTFRGGPGMTSPPPGLHIGGTARTALTMDNSKSYFYNTKVIAAGWAAISTDNANGNVYVEANQSEIIVTGPGYGVYSDTGCHVVINDSKITTQTYSAIMAGVAELAFNNVTVNSEANSVMIHSVFGSPSELATLNIKGGTFNTNEAVILVRSANANIHIEGGSFSPKNGALIQSVISDDENATKVNGQATPGINATIQNAKLVGDLRHEDTDRIMHVSLQGTSIKGRISNVVLSLDAGSQWTATADSAVTLTGSVELNNIDAAKGVTIYATAGAGNSLKGRYPLASGGSLIVG